MIAFTFGCYAQLPHDGNDGFHYEVDAGYGIALDEEEAAIKTKLHGQTVFPPEKGWEKHQSGIVVINPDFLLHCQDETQYYSLKLVPVER